MRSNLFLLVVHQTQLGSKTPGGCRTGSLLQRPKSSSPTGLAPGAWWWGIRSTGVEKRNRSHNMVFPCLLFQAGPYGQLPGICTVCLHLQWATRGETSALKHLAWKILAHGKVHTKHVFIPGSCWSGDQQWWSACCESHHPFGRTSAHGNDEKMWNYMYTGI